MHQCGMIDSMVMSGLCATSGLVALGPLVLCVFGVRLEPLLGLALKQANEYLSLLSGSTWQLVEASTMPAVVALRQRAVTLNTCFYAWMNFRMICHRYENHHLVSWCPSLYWIMRRGYRFYNAMRRRSHQQFASVRRSLHRHSYLRKYKCNHLENECAIAIYSHRYALIGGTKHVEHTSIEFQKIFSRVA